MAALNKNTAGKVKARVMSGVGKDGRKLTFEELQPDIQRLLDYASTMQGPNQSSWRAKLTSELNVRINELERERMDTAMANVSHAAYSQDMRIEAMQQKFQKAENVFQELKESMDAVSGGHEDLHETIDNAVDQHQTSSRSTDCMAQLMGNQCDAAAAETQVRDVEERARLEDSLVLLDTVEELEKGRKDDEKKLKGMDKTIKGVEKTNRDLSKQLEQTVKTNYVTKQEVLQRLSPTSLAKSSELAKELADKDKELSKQREATMKMKRKLQVHNRAHLAKRSMRDRNAAPTEYFSCTEGTATPKEDILCAAEGNGDATPTEGIISCKQGNAKEEPKETDDSKEVVKELQVTKEEESEEEESGEEESEEEESEEEESEEEEFAKGLEKEIEMKSEEQEYVQNRYGCMHTESNDCTHSDVAIPLPDYTMGIVQAPVLSTELQKLLALEEQTHSTAEVFEPEG